MTYIPKVSGHLVLNVDDFVIKKGHTYITGIHNLRGETMPDVLPGRKLDDLRAYASQHPDFRQLEPYAVVMDLAPADKKSAVYADLPLPALRYGSAAFVMKK